MDGLSPPLRIVIVDDEPPARARLRRLLAAEPGVEVVGEAGDAGSALALAAERAPQLMLLDIRMPGTDGVDLAASLPDPRPAVVFVSAHADRALDAFGVEAVDYLVKPVDPARLSRALARVRANVAAAPPRPPPGQLLIPDLGRLHVVAVDEIAWLEAADNYVVVHAGARAPLLRRTLAGLLDDLGDGFVQTHRSAAVALAHVVAVERLDGGEGRVRLRDGTEVRCARQRRTELERRLGSPG